MNGICISPLLQVSEIAYSDAAAHRADQLLAGLPVLVDLREPLLMLQDAEPAPLMALPLALARMGAHDSGMDYLLAGTVGRRQHRQAESGAAVTVASVRQNGMGEAKGAIGALDQLHQSEIAPQVRLLVEANLPIRERL